MPFLQMIVSLIVLGLLYKKMIGRDNEPKISKGQTIVPVVLGVVALPLSFMFVLLNGVAVDVVGIKTEEMSPYVRSVFSAFFAAGLPEEMAKLVFMLLAILIFHKHIKNVYAYILIGAAVGFGFTLFEEFMYGSGVLLVDALRIILLPSHMLFGIIMGKHLGLAKYSKVAKEGSAIKEYLLAVLIPVIIHTLYDACTGCNKLIKSENEDLVDIGVAVGLIAFVVMLIWQIIMLKKVKTDYTLTAEKKVCNCSERVKM
ncbi:MAG: PrsW family intramembrane metalloprotease [Lachnospiraceae bacterium]|nr:PrsW family intramembrane metalloprotease [Lachnospiraceae bacterium]